MTGLVVGVASMAVLASGVAFAAIPATGTGVITGCRSKTTGALRVVDAQAHQKCKSTEKALTWNSKGVAGARGPAGATGARGAAGPSGPKGSNAGAASPTLAAGDNYIYAVAAFTPVADATCVVTSTVQLDPTSAMPIGQLSIFVRNAVERAGADANDGVYGLYLTSLGTSGLQPMGTRSSVVAVTKGQPTRFGAYLGNVAGAAVGGTAFVQTSYICS